MNDEHNDELDDFARSLTPELRAQEEYLRAQIAVRQPLRPDEPPGQRGNAH